jgi:transposase, IS5 family
VDCHRLVLERGTSDAETVEQIRENPYLQYFLGLSEYSDDAPFDSSMMVHFRKRLNINWVGRINEAVVTKSREDQKASVCISEPPEEKKDGSDHDEPPSPPNEGQLIIDASCTPANPLPVHSQHPAPQSAHRPIAAATENGTS